jgi:hypothetical protein
MAGYSVTFSVVDQASAKIEEINKRLQGMRAPMERHAKVMKEFIDVSGLKKVAESFRAIGDAAGEAFSSMARLVPVMGTITGAASIAGMAELVRSWGDLGYELQKSGAQIGITAQQLYDLRQATRRAGGDADDMTESLKGVTQQMLAVKQGNTEAMVWMRRLGVDVGNANTGFKTTTEVLPQVIEGLTHIKDPAQRMQAAVGAGSAKLFDLAGAFERSGKTMQEWYNEAVKVDAQIDPKKTEQWDKAVGQLSATFTDLKETMGGVLADSILPLIREFDDWVKTHQPQIQKAITDIGNALVWLGHHVEAIKTALEVLLALWAGKWVIGIVSSIASVVTSIGGMTTALGGTSLALGALGKAFSAFAALTAGYELGSLLEQQLEKTAWGKKFLDTVGGGVAGAVLGATGTRPVDIPENIQQRMREQGISGAPSIAPGAGPTTFSGDKAEFLKKAMPLAQQVAAQTGLDPRVIVAQAALESGWGKHAPGQNFFGVGGAGNLRTYGSMEESFQDYAKVIQNKRYAGARAGKTPEAQIAGLVAGGYTGDAGYAESLQSIVKQLPAPAAAPPSHGRGTPPGGATGKPDPAGAVDAMLHMQGMTEQGDRDTITKFMKAGGMNLDPATTAWCAAYVNAALKTHGIRGTDSAVATSFGAWGEGVAPQDVAKGDVLLQARGHAIGEAGGHVGLATGRTRFDPQGNEQIERISGNLHDQIAKDWVDSRDLMVRRALEVEPRAMGAPAEVTGGPPVSGSVDVTVKHVNPPPGASVQASGTGDVDVQAPRVEQQQFTYAT